MVMHVKDAVPLWRLLRDAKLSASVNPCGGKNGQSRLVGFCQALLPLTLDPESHTKTFSSLLKDAGSAFNNSHELFLGHCDDTERFDTWFASACAPLTAARNGCVPVLITGLSVSNAQFIFNQKTHTLNEPVLVRIIVDDDLESVVHLMQRVAKRVLTGEMPAFYPLLQASISTNSEFWDTLRSALGSNWQYTCVAVDPWVDHDVRAIIREQTVVAQVPIGDATGLGTTITIAAGILAAWPQGTSYDFTRYVSSLDDDDIVIVLGPSPSQWSVEENRDRIGTIVQMLTHAGIPA